MVDMLDAKMFSLNQSILELGEQEAAEQKERT